MCYCIREYSLDQDVTHIVYKKFHGKPEEVYPSITLCFNEPFITSKLSEISENLTSLSYKNFLAGFHHGQWSFSFSDIDYDNVSINFLDYLRHMRFNLLNNDNLTWNVEHNTNLVDSHDSSNYGMVKPPEIYLVQDGTIGNVLQ